MIDPTKLKQFDKVVYFTNNRWTCETRLNEICDCGKTHKGWIMRHRYRCQVWWDEEVHLWKNSVMRSESDNKQRRKRNVINPKEMR